MSDEWGKPDKWDAMVTDLFARSAADPAGFPLHHALATALRWQVVEAFNRGTRRERAACVKAIEAKAAELRLGIGMDASAQTCTELAKGIVSKS